MSKPSITPIISVARNLLRPKSTLTSEAYKQFYINVNEAKQASIGTELASSNFQYCTGWMLRFCNNFFIFEHSEMMSENGQKMAEESIERAISDMQKMYHGTRMDCELTTGRRVHVGAHTMLDEMTRINHSKCEKQIFANCKKYDFNITKRDCIILPGDTAVSNGIKMGDISRFRISQISFLNKDQKVV